MTQRPSASMLAEFQAMTKKAAKKTAKVPPQLIGVHVDAVQIGATSFRLEPNPPQIMASFSTDSRATEIDFEGWAGQEMIDYLLGQISQETGKTGSFVLEYESHRYKCTVAIDRKRSPRWLEVTWA
jgi:hypothetical protein